MFLKQNAEHVGGYTVTPLAQSAEQGLFIASVSIRRGMYDRIFRFIPRFASAGQAVQYAMAEGRSLVLCNQLG
ncbi:hypothetical protein GCM10022279_03920 [Comamonas faecalis]|uniref:Uncharacterized protein n=1 Tax=Comamonas faecalis TaxID=1387849 RepID=A0ABP7QK22_9BURK